MTAVGMLCHATVGGSARVATHLASVLARRGFDVIVFATKRPAFRIPAEVEVRSLCDVPPDPRDALAVTIGPSEFQGLRELVVAAVGAGEVDVLHFHYALPFAALAHAVRKRLGDGSPRIVGTLHGTDVSVHGAHRPVRRRLQRDLAATDALTTVSTSHAILTRRQFELDPLVIPNFVDLDAFRPGEPCRRLRPRVVHISNFRPVKNTIGLARAFGKLRGVLDAELWLVGDGETLPATLRELRRNRVPSHAVRCFGMVDDPSTIVANADILALPSQAESFSLAALEALACGVPVVGTRVGGLAELIEGRGCGVLVELGDDDALAAALHDALERRELLRRAALRRAREFSIDRVVPLYEHLYAGVLNDRPLSTNAIAGGSSW